LDVDMETTFEWTVNTLIQQLSRFGKHEEVKTS
jgi:hypothetical protein